MNRPLEVLHVVESLGHGGAEQNLVSLLRRLPRDRFRSHVAWLYQDTQLLETLRPHVASLVPLSVENGLGHWRGVLRLADWMRHHQPDVVHAQLIRAQLVARAAAALGNRPPLVTTWQNAYYDERALNDFAGSRLRRAVIRVLDAFSSRRDSHFLGVSSHVARHCATALHLPRNRVSVLYNGVEPERYHRLADADLERVRAELGLRAGQRVLLSVGRLVPQKGQADLIAAIPRVIASVPDVVLLIAGGGPLEAALRSQVEELSLGEHVRILGRRHDIPSLYQIANVFVFPSRYEGMSVALVEALASGLPAVISDIPQNREVADGFASVRFVELERVDSLAQSITEMLTLDGALAPLAAEASASVRARFAPELLAQQFGEVITRVASRRATSGVGLAR